MSIDPRAVIAPGAKIGNNVDIAPYAIIDEHVTIGDNCQIGPHVYLTGHTTIGNGTEIHAGAIIGDKPQDVSFDDATVSYVDIGENCRIREYVTIHRGTEQDSHTVVGDRVMLMAFSHLGHNCKIANDVIIANATLLAGRVEVAEHATISAGVMIHQFVRIGRLAMIGGGNAITQDVPPFCLLQDDCIQSANIIGLRRSNMSDVARNSIHEAVKIYFFQKLARMGAVEEIQKKCAPCPELQEFIDFVLTTKRGITSGRPVKEKTA
ncbi:MAG: acyl-ACP--UDP-N-acetylglucosamine O-acyltransferase [Victivallales bacterium]|nr:acyl-ACP--UDP-N-acetylglucosamine O-acyltransferase [Victivallales bacterium]MBO7619334.1 acyl-ACP--UDP-N-acetylglucosamine O-acyltransferase [Victivallales bacterium]